jgi:hypothetical protein
LDPSVFGTCFERVMDETQRAQLGAHSAGFSDIATLVEPTVADGPHGSPRDGTARDIPAPAKILTLCRATVAIEARPVRVQPDGAGAGA